MVILDEWLVILERERHTHLPGVSGALDQTLAAPAPDLPFGKFFVDDGPIPFSNVVSGKLRMPCDAPPREEDAQMFCAQVSRHPDQLAHKTDLSLTHFRDRVAEIVVGGDPENLDAFAARQALQFLATSLRPIERIAVRSLAVDLDAVVAECFCGANEFRQGKGFPAIPAAEVGDAIESDFHKGQFVSSEFAGRPENRIVHERAIRWMAKRGMIVTELNEHDPGRRAGADPRDRGIAGWIVRDEQRFDVRRDEQSFVSLVRDMERAETYKG